MVQQNDFPIKSRRSQQDIHSLLSKFNASAMTVKQFCEENNIKLATFHKWQARRKQKVSGKKPVSGFAEIKINSSGLSLFAEVFAASCGKSIRIYREVPASFLKELAS